MANMTASIRTRGPGIATGADQNGSTGKHMKSELSPAALAVAIEESDAEFNRVMDRSPLVELDDSREMLTVLTRVAHPWAFTQDLWARGWPHPGPHPPAPSPKNWARGCLTS